MKLWGDVVADLRKRRIDLGLSQAQVAEQLGTTQSAIARLESGSADPRLSTLQRYAEVVGVGPGRQAGPSLDDTASSVRESLAQSDPGEAFRHVIQFLDDVSALDSEAVSAAIRLEPARINPHWDALLAGIAEYTARQAGIAVPGWASSPARFLDHFWFPVEDIMGRPVSGLSVATMISSSSELSTRGVFVDRSSLVSV